MSEHKASVTWKRDGAEYTYEKYPREHDVRYAGGVTIRASSAPEFLGRGEHPNPEEELVGAISSCHMLTFLAVAAKRKLVVDSYEDDAVGVLEKNENGKLAITRVTLKPRITWAGESPTRETLERIHATSHRECFVANSVRTAITVEID